MKSVKKYSKKKPRVQPKVQARSNKKQINKKVSKKVNKRVSNGTKKVKRNKNKKLTKKNAQSGGFLFRRKRPVKTIFFDVDGTLGDTGCGGGTPDDGDNYNKKELLRLLDTLKEKGVRLFILTRCNSGGNICNDDQKGYYEPIVERMDGVFAADVLEIDVNRRLRLTGVDGGMTWAAIKTMVMEEYCESKNIQRGSVVLIDDDYRNARVAYKHRFRAFHNNKSEIEGAALKMTNGALEKILKEMGVRSQSGSRYTPQKDFFDVSEESEAVRKVYKYSKYSKLSITEREGKLFDLTGELTQDIKEKIKNSIEKSKKVCFTLVLIDGTKLNDINESSLFRTTSSETSSETSASAVASSALEEFNTKFSEPANDTDIGVFVLYYGNNHKINLKYFNFKTGEYSLIKYPISEKIKPRDIQNTLNDSSFQESLVKIISKLEREKQIKFRFLPNGHPILDNEFEGFGDTGNNHNILEKEMVEITVVDEKRNPINLIKQTRHDTVKFEVSDFFMNEVLAREALEKLGTQKGFALYFGSNGRLCGMLKTETKMTTFEISEEIEALQEKAEAEKIKYGIFAKKFNTMESTARRPFPPAASGKKVVDAEEEAARHNLIVATEKAKEKIAELLSEDIFNLNMGSIINRYLRTNITESSKVVFKKPPQDEDEFEGFGFEPTIPPVVNNTKSRPIVLVNSEPTFEDPSKYGFGPNAPTGNNGVKLNGFNEPEPGNGTEA